MAQNLRIFYGFDLNLAESFGMQGIDIWTANIYDTLKDMGHDLVHFDYKLGEFFHNLEKQNKRHVEYSKRNRQIVVDEFLRQIKKAHKQKPIDILFSYFYDHFMIKEAIEEVKKLGILTVNYNCNASYQLDLISDISPAFDYCLTVEKFRLDDYKKLGANPVYFQEGANPKYYKPYDLEKIYDVVFIGQCYGDRPSNIKYLINNNIDIKVFGPAWNNVISTPHKEVKNLFYKLISKKRKIRNLLPSSIIGKKLEFTDMIKTYSKSKIAINFATCGETHLSNNRITQIRLRDFEAPMSGVCYMTEYNEELEEFYKIDKEIVCYSSIEELKDKIEFYLKNDKAREAIRKAGYERAVGDHSWEQRFKKCFKEIKIS